MCVVPKGAHQGVVPLNNSLELFGLKVPNVCYLMKCNPLVLPLIQADLYLPTE